MFQLYYQYQVVLPDTQKCSQKKMFVLRSNENGVDSFVVIYFFPTVCHYVLLRPIHIYIHLFCCELINWTFPSSQVITFRLFTFPNKIAVSDLLPLDVVRFCKYVPPHLPRNIIIPEDAKKLSTTTTLYIIEWPTIKIFERKQPHPPTKSQRNPPELRKTWTCHGPHQLHRFSFKVLQLVSSRAHHLPLFCTFVCWILSEMKRRRSYSVETQ